MDNFLRSFNVRRRTREGWEFPLLIGVVLLAFTTRLGVAVATTSWVFPSDKNFAEFGYEMGQIAASLVMGNGFSWPEWSNHALGPTAWMPPVYPVIMAATFKVFGIYSKEAAVVLELFQTIMSVVTCLLLYFLGKRLYNAEVGLIAAFLLAMYPPAIHYSVRIIWGTNLFIFCLLLLILMFLRQADHPCVKGGMRLGFMLGFTALVDPIIVGTYPFALAWLYMKADSDRRTIVKTITAVLIFSCLVLSPWLARNYVVFGQFVFIKSNLGDTLFMGNNEYATGRYEDAFSRHRKNNPTESLTETEREYIKGLDEISRNSFLLQKGIAFIMDHPLSFARRTANRFAAYWTYIRPVDTWQGRASQFSYFMLLILGIAGLLLTNANVRGLQLVLLFILLLPVPYYFTVVGIFRYRFPIEPILMIFAGHTIYWVACQCKGRVFHTTLQ